MPVRVKGIGRVKALKRTDCGLDSGHGTKSGGVDGQWSMGTPMQMFM